MAKFKIQLRDLQEDVKELQGEFKEKIFSKKITGVLDKKRQEVEKEVESVIEVG
jgi:hypothetical protein